ncbi:NAD(P)-binding protein [Westerdykella ornata]|uniref:NAD(P)-binding protein n=1 Tax=Westerdykella ornata TaxID=318751 RepID=A0A6A6JQQ7_WESOR|nr:NAD(P)-binding protein [Westerdykella ornata]KAF2278574.1 NAD(P)-binding protein [Westerdykella ornata]
MAVQSTDVEVMDVVTSGYLGGTLLAHLQTANLPPYSKLYALVRTPAQAEGVRQYGATPLNIDLSSRSEIHDTILSNNITIIFHLISAFGAHTTPFIEALATVREATGHDVHFIFTSGAKLFSSHAGAPTSQPLFDTDPNLFAIHEAQVPKYDIAKSGIDANIGVIETGERLGVKSYVFVPCIVYGPGEGFGNKISIQTVAVVKAALSARKVYKVDHGRTTWPVCHVRDTVGLYVEMLKAILDGRSIGYGKNVFYLAASGSVAWDDLYERFAKALKERGKLDTVDVGVAGEEDLKRMAQGIGCEPFLVPMQLAGLCTFTAEHGKQIGWTPRYKPEDILDRAEEEVEFILQNLTA